MICSICKQLQRQLSRLRLILRCGWKKATTTHKLKCLLLRLLLLSRGAYHLLNHPIKELQERSCGQHIINYTHLRKVHCSVETIYSRSVGVSSCAIFYQHVGDFMIKELIKENFKVCSSTHVDQEPVLNMYEANALRYAAGYIPRALRKKLQNSAEPLKDKLIICLLDLLDDGEDKHVESHEWILSIDRGGLCHVNNTCYLLFQAMELEIRRHIQNDPTPNFLHVQISLMYNDDVLFYWSIIGCDWEEEESAALLPMVVNLWITIRGFSYCSAWVEKYKAEHKKSVQKSKGVRKQLISSSHTTKVQS